jgi:uncharacterized protein with GYD domain
MEDIFGMFMGLVAILMIFGIPLLAIWTKHRKEVLQMQLQATAEKAAQYAASNQELEDRVRVLERIVTDGGYDVATQIEALRDQRRVEDKLEDQRESSRN